MDLSEALVAAALGDVIRDIGSYAGFAAVLGLAILSALYFSQARDVRRLREWAGAAPEVAEMSAAEADELRKREEERAREERRQRRARGVGESRFTRMRDRLSGGMPEPRYLAVIIGGVVVLGAAAAGAGFATGWAAAGFCCARCCTAICCSSARSGARPAHSRRRRTSRAWEK